MADHYVDSGQTKFTRPWVKGSLGMEYGGGKQMGI